MGTDEEPGRRASMDAPGRGRRGHGAGRARREQAPRADDDDGRSGAARRSGLREDLAPLHAGSAGLRRRLRPRMVQADASRHGPACALPGQARAQGRDDLARPGTAGRSSAGRRSGRDRAQGQDPGEWAEHFATGDDGLGVGVDLPRRGQAGRRQRRPHPPGAAEGMEVNQPAELEKVLSRLETLRQEFNAGLGGGKKISLADLIVLAGGAGVEAAAKKAGITLTVPFSPGRTDASQDQTDVESFEVLEPMADGFRNYIRPDLVDSAAELLIDKAQLLTLSAPEMTALIGGLRVLGANFGQSTHGVFTATPETLSNDFFVNLLDMRTRWQRAAEPGVLEGRDRTSGALKWTGTAVDLVFGSNAVLRALAEVYASSDGKEVFARDFVKAWTKVMNLDRYDLL
ncbi:peroxidase domain-containing protein [Ditylenchus destructor]|nr:peroxidase domain-containing protein [Ditylenchus destructor]